MNYELKPNKRQLQYQHTLENIRSAVDELVSEKGFEAMTIRDICQRAGIKTGGFYHHFASKDDLLFDRYHRVNEYFKAYYKTNIQGKSSIEGLRLLIEAFFDYLKSRVLPMMIQYNRTYNANQAAWESKEPSACAEISLQLIEQGQQTGEFKREYPAKDINDFLWCLIDGAVLKYCATQGVFLSDGVLEQMLDGWIESLRS